MLQIIGYIVILGALGALLFVCGRKWIRDIRAELSGGGCSGCCASCSHACRGDSSLK